MEQFELCRDFRCVQVVSKYSEPLVSSDVNSVLGGVLSGSGIKLLEQREEHWHNQTKQMKKLAKVCCKLKSGKGFVFKGLSSFTATLNKSRGRRRQDL